MSDDINVKPCPFCGGRAEFDRVSDSQDPNYGGEFIKCARCESSTALVFPLKDDVKSLLLDRWNRRSTQVESLTAERAELADRVAELERDAAILKRIDAFTNLEPGWDGYRGAPLSARTAEKAKEIFRVLPPLNWQVVLGGDGSVQFEYHGQEWDIEVSIIDAAREVKS